MLGIFRFLRLALVAYLLVLLAMMIFENALIFLPARHPIGDWKPHGLAVEDAWFSADDGTRLHGWYLEHPEPRAVMLMSHGNGGNITHRDESLRAFQALGITLLLFDYRGYGRSDGQPSEAGILADARAARAWLAERAGVSTNDIVLYGESLGGAVAVDLAAAEGARGLILENTFNTLPDVAAHHFRWIPVRWLLQTRLDSAAKIGRYHGPLLQVHGDADTIVPLECAQRLFAAANQPKRMLIQPGGEHNDPPSRAWLGAVDEFLNGLTANPRPRSDRAVP